MEKNLQSAKKWGGKRNGAGRPRGTVRRFHKTIWVSEEEYRQVVDLLLKIQQADSGNP